VSKRRVLGAAAVVFLLTAASASAAVTAEFFYGMLTVSSDASDAITVTCSGGMAKVNGADPEGDPARCAQVETVEITGGPGPNSIDLAGVTAAAYSGAESVAVFGDDGADTITGSPLRDELQGDAADDTLRGNAGNDGLSGGEGSDRVFGGAGDDTISALFGNDVLDGQAGSDTYQLDLFDLGPSVRVADTGTEGADAIEVTDCEGVTVEAGQILREGVRVAVSGIERFPCDFVPPPAPPPPPAARPACIVPKLRGRTLARARVLLARAHCRVGKVTRVRSHVKRGIVLGQRPAAGRRQAPGAKVSLRVSRGS
jgi:hemolysin type calcium-binding protein/PASTA domain-containing protein